MKLEVSQPEGTPHEVELPDEEIVIGRDPSCDLVLNDNRCSRRHAIIEPTPDGFVVRDAGSANGIFVNGRRMERSPLGPGDRVRVGATVLTVLGEVAETLVAPPGGHVPDAAPRAAPRHSASARRRPPGGRAGAVPTRGDPPLPLTITTLAVLWGLSAPAFLASGILVAARGALSLPAGAVAVGAGLLLGAIGVLMALGLRARAAWARHLQIGTAALGLFICPFTFASVTVLLYMLRADVRSVFEANDGERGSGAGAAEPTVALSLLGMLALGLVATAVVLFALSKG